MIDTLKKLISFFDINEKKKGLKIIFLVFFMAILDTLGVVSIMPFLGVIGNPVIIEKNQYLNLLFVHSTIIGVRTHEDFIIILGILSFILVIFSSLFRIFALYSINQFTERMRYKISSKLLSIYLGQKYDFFLNRHTSELSKSILSEIDHIVVGLIRPIVSMIAYVFVALFIISFLVLYNPKIAFTTAGTIGLFYFIFFISIKGKMKTLGETLVRSNKERFKIASEVLSSIKLIKLRGIEENYETLYRNASKNFSKPLSVNLTFTILPKYLVEALAFGGVILIVVILIFSGGGLSNNALGTVLPVVGLYVFAAYRLQPAIQSIFNGLSALRFGHSAVNNLYYDMQLKTYSNDSCDNELLQFKKMISLHNLSFLYPNSTNVGLSGINFAIPFGTSVGIVGTTGSGKTTLVDILLGLLTPTNGCIKVDNIKLDKSNIRSWQGNLGYVPQEITLLDCSIGENISMGIPKKDIDWVFLDKCVRIAQIKEFIENELPQKYDTNVGERGIRLSGGQRQRIGIARALYHNPSVLVLDEATSALDTATENAVMESIKNLSSKKTIVIIAHRLITLQNCDQIILLDHGEIKKIGTYKEVIKYVK